MIPHINDQPTPTFSTPEKTSQTQKNLKTPKKKGYAGKCWTQAENQLFFEFAEKHKLTEKEIIPGEIWKEIAKALPKRTAEQCRDHWRKQLNKQPRKRKPDNENGPEERIHKVARKQLSTSPHESLNLEVPRPPNDLFTLSNIAMSYSLGRKGQLISKDKLDFEAAKKELKTANQHIKQITAEKEYLIQMVGQFQEKEIRYLAEQTCSKRVEAELQQTIQKQQDECAAIEEEKKTLQTTFTRLEQEKNAFQNKLEAASQQIEEIKKERNLFSRDLFQAKKNGAELQQTIQKQQDTCAAMEKEKKTLQTTLAHLEQEKNTFQNKFEAANQQIEEIRKEKDLLSQHKTEIEMRWYFEKQHFSHLTYTLQTEIKKMEELASTKKEKLDEKFADFVLPKRKLPNKNSSTELPELPRIELSTSPPASFNLQTLPSSDKPPTLLNLIASCPHMTLSHLITTYPQLVYNMLAQENPAKPPELITPSTNTAMPVEPVVQDPLFPDLVVDHQEDDFLL